MPLSWVQVGYAGGAGATIRVQVDATLNSCLAAVATLELDNCGATNSYQGSDGGRGGGTINPDRSLKPLNHTEAHARAIAVPKSALSQNQVKGSSHGSPLRWNILQR